MGIHKQIKAIFFLAIVAMMMAHNAIPHIHALHDIIDGAHEYIGHHHSTVHHGQEGASEASLFSVLLTGHAQFYHSHEHIIFTRNEPQLDKATSSVPVVEILKTCGLLPRGQEQNWHRYFLFKERFYDNPCLVDCPLRAPPSLG